MKIIYYDGSTLECHEIQFYDGVIIADGIYEIPIYEVLRIEEA